MRCTLAVTALLTALGCGRVEQVYTWTRQEPALGRRSPTVFVVRVRVDEASKTVTVIEDVHDSDGDLGRNIDVWKECEIFNGSNWSCGHLYMPPDSCCIEMKDGELDQHYWGEYRQFRSRYTLRTDDLLPARSR